MAGFLEIRAANGSYIWYRDRITHARRQRSFSIDSGRRRKGREASSVQCLKHDTLLLPISDLSLLLQASLLGLLGSVQILLYYSTGQQLVCPQCSHIHTHKSLSPSLLSYFCVSSMQNPIYLVILHSSIHLKILNPHYFTLKRGQVSDFIPVQYTSAAQKEPALGKIHQVLLSHVSESSLLPDTSPSPSTTFLLTIYNLHYTSNPASKVSPLTNHIIHSLFTTTIHRAA